MHSIYWPIGKADVHFLFVIIELFSLSLTVESRKLSKSAFLERGGSI